MKRYLRVAEGEILNEGTFNDVITYSDIKIRSPWMEMIRSSMGEGYACGMTHGDFHPCNITVDNEE